LEAILTATDTSMKDAMHLSRYKMEFWKKIYFQYSLLAVFTTARRMVYA